MSGPEENNAEKTAFVAKAWRLLKPYWQSPEDKWSKWLFLSGVGVTGLGQVGATLLITNWTGAFFNNLASATPAMLGIQAAQFVAYAGIAVASGAYNPYFRRRLQLKWRRWLTDHHIDKWLDDNTSYRMQQKPDSSDNPDQRIADDVNALTVRTQDLGFNFFNNAISVVSFSTLLWSISGAAHLAVAGFSLTIPGYMMWAAIGFAGLGTWVTHQVGKHLPKLDWLYESVEAGFRYQLVRNRIYAREIAQTGGATVEKDILKGRFGRIEDTWRQTTELLKRISLTTTGYAQLAIVVPLLLAAPGFIAKKIGIGGFMQTVAAFGQVQTSLSWLINSYTEICAWKASVNRLWAFNEEMAAAKVDRLANAQMLSAPKFTRDLMIENMNLSRPDPSTGEDIPLIDNFDLTLKPGQRLIITGPSGHGKSTLLLALQGLWSKSAGRVCWPENAKVMCVPQRPYLPSLPLAGILAYPGTTEAGRYSQAEMATALADAGLAKLIPALTTDALDGEQLSKQLSGGEQQRLRFAQLFLQRPDFILLDEATSALDPESNIALHQTLMEKLPEAAIINVAHHENLKEYHTLAAQLTKNRTVIFHQISDTPEGLAASNQNDAYSVKALSQPA